MARWKWKREPKLLLGCNIPKPLHGVAPRVVLGTPWWDKVRREAYESTNFHCKACGISKYQTKQGVLDAHERYEVDYLSGKLYYIEAVPLCKDCHNFIHDGRLQWLLDTRKIRHQEFTRIIRHGNTVLREAGLVRLTAAERVVELKSLIANGALAAWEDWRLVVDGKEYPPKFKTEAEADRHYA